MTATERAKRSNALFHDSITFHRRDLCDMIALRESDMEELRAENARLRFVARCLAFCFSEGLDCDGCAINGKDMHVDVAGNFACDSIRVLIRELKL